MLTGYTIQLWAIAVTDYGIMGSEMDDDYQLATELLVFHLMQEEG